MNSNAKACGSGVRAEQRFWLFAARLHSLCRSRRCSLEVVGHGALTFIVRDGDAAARPKRIAPNKRIVIHPARDVRSTHRNSCGAVDRLLVADLRGNALCALSKSPLWVISRH